MQSVSQSVTQSLSQSISQSVSQSINQSVSQPTNQPNQPVNHLLLLQYSHSVETSAHVQTMLRSFSRFGAVK